MTKINLLGIVIMVLSVLGVLMAGIGQVVVQCIKYGAFLEFRIIPHWTLYGLLGILTFIPGFILFGSDN